MQMDLAADLGRSTDEAVLEAERSIWPLISTVAIPCAAHAGDPLSMLLACGEATSRGLSIGAAVGYRDASQSGRFIDYARDELAADLLFQLGGLDGLLSTEGRISFVRPAGALFEAVQTDRNHSWALVDAVLDFDPKLTVVGLTGSALLATAARHGLRTAVEAQPWLGAAPSGGVGRLLTDPEVIVARALDIVHSGEADLVALSARSTADLVAARAIREAFDAAGVTIAAHTASSPGAW